MNNLYVESYGQKFVAWGVFYGSIACMRYFLDNVVAESLKLVLLYTSSPAVTERPRDVSCLSVVSFNSTILRAQCSVISYFRFRFTAAYK